MGKKEKHDEFEEAASSSTIDEPVKEAPNWPAAEIEIGEKPIWRRLVHWGTGFAYFVIAYVGSVSTFFAIQWLPIDTPLGLINLLVFLLWNGLTMSNLYTASYIGPGYLPRNWRPHKPKLEENLQFCNPCGGYKAPRSHHCSKCNRCCLKMDHHCPWINNCVGHRNHSFFIRFLFFAIVGCIHAAIIDVNAMYHAIFAGWYLKYGNGSEPIIYVTPYSFVALMMAFALALGIIIALTVLLVTQMKFVFKNMNGIEQYIDGKAKSLREQKNKKGDGCEHVKEWVYPYSLGWKRNFREVFVSIFDGRTRGNGIYWPVKSGCDQFTFTKEQLLQKEMKRECSRHLFIAEDFEGKMCSARKYGWRICMKQPVIDGKCLKVKAGDPMVATRGVSGWAYGYKEANPVEKGWVPIACTNLKLKSETEKEEDDEDEVTDLEEEEKKNK